MSPMRLLPLLSTFWVAALRSARGVQTVMNSIALRWNFDYDANGWAQAPPLEMLVDVDAVNGYLRGTILPHTPFGAAFVDSPALRVVVDAAERDVLVIRMKYLGPCATAMVALERDDTSPHNQRHRPKHIEQLVDPVEIPFSVHTNNNGIDHELFYVPIWRYVTGTVTRVRFHPCVALPPSEAETAKVATPFGQTFQIDWIAFTKAPLITKVRGCIDQYFENDDDATPQMNCTEHVRLTNGIHRSAAFDCNAMALPLATTYNCGRQGNGQRIRISGKHFGVSDAVVTVDGVECTDVVHITPETELECTLSPAASDAALGGQPSVVRVQNGQLNGLEDTAPLLTFAAPVSARPAPVLSNVAAHALDVNWLAPVSVEESMTVTGYIVRWKQCTATAFDDVVIVGNVTSTTLLALHSNTAYHVTVAALTEDYRARAVWQDVDLYGQRRRGMMDDAVVGVESPLSLCVTTLVNDISFPQFTAQLLTNVTAVREMPVTAPTLGPTGEIGDQGHFGLYVNGHANVEHCNASVTCCDGYDDVDTASCTYTCSETTLMINGATTRSLPTNALFALPFPAKAVHSSSSDTPSSSSATVPVTSACGPALRLTASQSLLTGAAWYPRQMNVREGFATTFTFRLANPSTHCMRMDDVSTTCRSRGGDGFAFVVQNDGALSVGSGGMELGYGGLRNALAVEFDSWFNAEQLDAYENHVSVHASGCGAVLQANHTLALGTTSRIGDLTDGDHDVKIVYDPNLDESMVFADHFTASAFAGSFLSAGDWLNGVGLLAVYLDDMDTPVLSVPLRLERSLELHHGRAWVGFTAATGERAWQSHDILRWTFDSLRHTIVAGEQVAI